MPAAVGQRAQRLPPLRPAIGFGELHPQRRNAGEHGDVMTSDRPDHVARQEIIEGDDAAARRPGREQLVLAIVEGQRQHARASGRGGEAEDNARR